MCVYIYIYIYIHTIIYYTNLGCGWTAEKPAARARLRQHLIDAADVIFERIHNNNNSNHHNNNNNNNHNIDRDKARASDSILLMRLMSSFGRIQNNILL